MKLSDSLVELEQLGGDGPQLMEIGQLGLLFINSVRAGLPLLHTHRHTHLFIYQKNACTLIQFHFVPWCPQTTAFDSPPGKPALVEQQGVR